MATPSVNNNFPRLHTENDLQTAIEAPTYILRPILPRGRLVLLVGNSTAGKTPLIYQLVNDLLGQRPFLDYFPFENDGPVNVAVIDAESLPEDITYRIRLQRTGRPIQPTGKLRYTDRESTIALRLNLHDPCSLLELVKNEQIDVLILDNLWALSDGLDITKGNVASQTISQLSQVIALPHKPVVVILHHPRKSAVSAPLKCSILDPDFIGWLQELSGSMVWVNRTDVRIGLERVTRNDAEFTVLRGRHRVPGGEQDIGPLYLTIDEKHDLATIDKSPDLLASLGPKQQEIVAKLRLKRKFTTEQALSPEVRGTNTSKKTVYRTLNLLKAHGFLTQTPDGYEWIEPMQETKPATSKPVIFTPEQWRDIHR